MLGLSEFEKLFGDISVLRLIEVVLAGVFLFLIYKKIKKYLIETHEREKEKDNKINEALGAVRKYPEYRKQSVEIQKNLESQIQSLRTSQEELKNTQKKTIERLTEMEELTKKRERNKLRDLLLKSYRYYTNPKTNPSLSWTKVESETFWELFKDYEEAGGNGHMRSDVMPAMEKLVVIDI